MFIFLGFTFTDAVELERIRSNDLCQGSSSLKPRPHSVSILDFGAVGDGKTLNTVAFQNAIFYLKSFADKGGAQLYVPAGRWLTKSFTLTSNLTLFIENGATIIASQVRSVDFFFLFVPVMNAKLSQLFLEFMK